MNNENRQKNNPPKSQTLVYMMVSGGVDSSVAAQTLVDMGYTVIGVYMRCWSMESLKKLELPESLFACQSDQDEIDAMLVCQKIGIPFEVWDFQEEYLNKVVGYMIREYSLGYTPNPDVMCNGNIKFGIFYEKAMSLGADFVASGHYAANEIPN